MLCPGTSEVLREQVWMAERMTEQPATSLVEVLPIDEHDDPRRGVGGKSSNGRIRHGQEKAPVIPREAGAHKLLRTIRGRRISLQGGRL